MILILTPDRGSKGRPGDFAGAFRPEADNFKLINGGKIERIDQSLPAERRYRQAVAFVEEHQPDTLAYFGHGLSRSLPSMGASITNVAALAGALARASTGPRVVLYACLAAEDLTSGAAGLPGGDGGFADALRDACVKQGAPGVQVDAHGSSSQLKGRIHDLGGHTTQNPYVRRYSGPETKESVGGEWIVSDQETLWRAWVKALRGPMRFQFPFLTRDQIRARLRPVDA